MPSIATTLYSVFFKLYQKHKLQTLTQSSSLDDANPFGITCRPEEPIAAPNPTFSNGVATKDIHIDPFSSLCLRIFLPDTANPPRKTKNSSTQLENSTGKVVYKGYAPSISNGNRKFPVILQFHEGCFVSGSNVSVGNDVFCRRMVKLCDVIVVAVGYRLAPENRYPAAFEDGLKVLNWLAKQGNLAECGRSLGNVREVDRDVRKSAGNPIGLDSLGASMIEPWLAAHGDLSRCVLLGASCGANIANYVAQKAVEAGKLLNPVKVVAQVLMYPFFMGSVPTNSEIKLANTYFYDKNLCMLAWKLFLNEEEFGLDHLAASPLNRVMGGVPPLKCMPPTLTVVAEHDWMRDLAIAYSEELRKASVDAPLLDYKDAVHGFATLDVFLQTPQAHVCAEDIAIWVKKYISLRGHEFSY